MFPFSECFLRDAVHLCPCSVWNTGPSLQDRAEAPGLQRKGVSLSVQRVFLLALFVSSTPPTGGWISKLLSIQTTEHTQQ